jgi:FAD binding domain-containing protein/berberine-like enzyme
MTTPAARTAVMETSVQDLRGSLRGPVLVPGDDGYDAARSAWNAMVDKHPALIVQPVDAADVATTIAFARREGLELGVKCGGHSVVGQAIPEGGLQVDLSRINAVDVDPDVRLARVGGGALLRNLDQSSLEHGLATTAGNVSHTGVGGLTLGGGMGWLGRQFGMACDNVLKYEIVTADGEILTASETVNSDLYWGLRGGGGNFGVVTEFTFRLHPITNRALSVDIFYAAEDGPAVIRAFRDMAAWAPPAANPTAWTGTAPESPLLPAELHGTDLVTAGFVWIGDPEEGRRLIPALRDVAKPLAEVIDESTYLELQASADEAMKPGLRRYWKGHYLRELSDAAIEAFLGRGGPAADGELRAKGSLLAYGGAIGQVGIGDTAFSHRDAMFEFITTEGWEDPAEDQARMGAPRRFAAAMEPFASGVYVNVLADEATGGVQAAYYASTLERLTSLKDRYDPDNVFHLNHNIPPSR